MACFHLVKAWQLERGTIVFAERGKILRELKLPCGQCIGCRLERSRQWAVRCIHERQMHVDAIFVTLTYEKLERMSLYYPDFQDFMKRLRHKFPLVRYYMCGEYGENYGRPHFHALLFGVDFSDRIYFGKSPAGERLYTSEQLFHIWKHGFCSIGEVTFESAGYVARYATKAFMDGGDGKRRALDEYFVDKDTGEIFPFVPEFNRMSLKPGIGASWFKKYCDDVVHQDCVVVRGVKMKPPRYYDELLRRADVPLSRDVITDVRLAAEFGRFAKARAVEADTTPERLEVREVVTKSRLAFKTRSLK